MLKFFRNIRQKLLAEGKTSKYLKYAIGEIVLVNIGILIALQINNWNEARKEAVFEKKVITELLMDVKEDLLEMEDAFKELNESQRFGKQIIEAFRKNIHYKDSMDMNFTKALRLWSLSPNSTAFDAVKSEGLYLIKNDTIRKMLSKIKGYYFDYLRVLESRWQDYHNSIVFPYTLPLFENYNYISMKANDYESLKNDPVYQKLIDIRTLYVYS